MRLQADRRPAQMRLGREARPYKKYRVEITINFARLFSNKLKSIAGAPLRVPEMSLDYRMRIVSITIKSTCFSVTLQSK